MSTSTFVTFYKSQEYGDALPTYTGPQAQSSPSISYISSLKTGSDTWLIVYQKKNFGGDAMQLGPNTSIYDLDKVHTNRDGGDWNNQISSFMMYDHQPSFWASGATSPRLDLQDGKVLFAENDDFEGDCKTYHGTNNARDMNDCRYGTNGTNRDMKNNISSLASGSNAWLQVYDGRDFTGNVLKVRPNTQYPSSIMSKGATATTGRTRSRAFTVSIRTANQHPGRSAWTCPTSTPTTPITTPTTPSTAPPLGTSPRTPSTASTIRWSTTPMPTPWMRPSKSTTSLPPPPTATPTWC